MDEVGLVAEMGSGAGRREWRVRFKGSPQKTDSKVR